MRIMITGACGFLGRNLADALRDKHKLVLVDRTPELFDTKEDVEFSFKNVHTADVFEDIFEMKSLMRGVDVVLNCAAQTRIPKSWAHYKDYYNDNITGTAQLFHLAMNMGVKKFIQFSSSSVYGNNGQTIQTEDGLLCPTNPYAVSKLAGEHALRVQAEGSDTELVIVRPFTMYGQYMKYGDDALVIAKFLEALEKDEPLVLHAAGTPSRDFLHSSDAVIAIQLIIEHSKHGDVFNLGSGTSVTVKQLADCVSSKQIVAPNRRGPVQRTCADISRLRSIGFNPSINVLEWLTGEANEVKLRNNIKQTEEA
jgi:UDP-glucose 4-epimerase